MTIELKAIRERAARFPTFSIDHEVDKCAVDRAQLLALIDRLASVVRRVDCVVDCGTHDHPPKPCTCGLDDLLRDLDGDARGGGR